MLQAPRGQGESGFLHYGSVGEPARYVDELQAQQSPCVSEFVTIFRDEPDFPGFIVMEYLYGQEVTTDSICLDGKELLTTVKTVEQVRWGVIVRGELVRRPDLVEQTRKILRIIPLGH